jgi:hypothetical protein
MVLADHYTLHSSQLELPTHVYLVYLIF